MRFAFIFLLGIHLLVPTKSFAQNSNRPDYDHMVRYNRSLHQFEIWNDTTGNYTPISSVNGKSVVDAPVGENPDIYVDKTDGKLRVDFRGGLGKFQKGHTEVVNTVNSALFSVPSRSAYDSYTVTGEKPVIVAAVREGPTIADSINPANALNQVNQPAACRISNDVDLMNERKGNNFDFVRCQLSQGDRNSQFFSMIIDTKKDPTALTVRQNTNMRAIEQPWIDASPYKNEVLGYLNQVEGTPILTSPNYPAEFRNRFLLNGPMHEADGSPTGLLIVDGQVKSQLNMTDFPSSDKDGAFYGHTGPGDRDGIIDPSFSNGSQQNPNGVIIVHKDGSVVGYTRSEAHVAFSGNPPREPTSNIQMAFQGGPIVSMGDRLNSKFGAASANIKPRVLACVTAGGRLRLLSSNSESGENYFSTANAALAKTCSVPVRDTNPTKYTIHNFAQEDICKFTLYVDGASGVVDANSVSLGLLSGDSTHSHKNFFDLNLY